MAEIKRIRILIAKVGSDIHEWGPFMLLQAFREAGFEAIYTGRYQTPEGVARAALTEDVDIIALSDHTGSMPIIADSVQKALKNLEAADIHIMAGGLITPADKKKLDEMGVTGNYGAGAKVEDVVDHVKKIMGHDDLN